MIRAVEITPDFLPLEVSYWRLKLREGIKDYVVTPCCSTNFTTSSSIPISEPFTMGYLWSTIKVLFCWKH